MRPHPRAHVPAWLLQTLTIAAITTVGVVQLAIPTRAHADLEASQPEDGATVSTPLDAVVLEFDEPVSAPEVTVTDPTGADIARGEARVDRRRVTQPLGPLEDTGRYTVTYQVLSADDHPAFGEIAFTYTGPTGEEPSDEARPPASPDDAGPGPAGGAEPAPASDAENAATLWPLLAVGAGAVVVLAVGAYALRALTRRAHPEHRQK